MAPGTGSSRRELKSGRFTPKVYQTAEGETFCRTLEASEMVLKERVCDVCKSIALVQTIPSSRDARREVSETSSKHRQEPNVSCTNTLQTSLR